MPLVLGGSSVARIKAAGCLPGSGVGATVTDPVRALTLVSGGEEDEPSGRFGAQERPKGARDQARGRSLARQTRVLPKGCSRSPSSPLRRADRAPTRLPGSPLGSLDRSWTRQIASPSVPRFPGRSHPRQRRLGPAPAGARGGRQQHDKDVIERTGVIFGLGRLGFLRRPRWTARELTPTNTGPSFGFRAGDRWSASS